MKIQPILRDKGATITFGGFPPIHRTQGTNPAPTDVFPNFGGMLNRPIPPEGIGEKLDIIA